MLVVDRGFLKGLFYKESVGIYRGSLGIYRDALGVCKESLGIYILKACFKASYWSKACFEREIMEQL